MKKKIIVVTALITALTSSAAWSGKAEVKVNAGKLGSALKDYMSVTYMCQNYVGGLEMYRNAKHTTENIFNNVGMDKNDVVLLIQKVEDEIKLTQPELAIEKDRERRNDITDEDMKYTCNEMIIEAQESIKLQLAKLRML